MLHRGMRLEIVDRIASEVNSPFPAIAAEGSDG
jgi:hypothetical protein